MDAARGDFRQPDESQRFSKRRVQIINLGVGPVRRVEVDAGWRWSVDERPELNTPSCELPHVGYVASGGVAILMDDGRRLDITEGQVFEIPPGHDAWTLGAAPCVFIDFAATRRPAAARRRAERRRPTRGVTMSVEADSRRWNETAGSNGRVQVAISADGTEIVGRVRGQGPPLVLVHGAWGDGEVAYEALVPHLTDRFTCYTPSTRGRGLSGDNPDHSVHRLVQDVTAFIDTIGGPVYLVGWSGIEPPLGAAAHSGAVAALALFEGYVPLVAQEGDLASLRATIERTAAAAADGRLVDAARAFAPFVLTDEELAGTDEDFFERWGRTIPAMLRYFQQNVPSEGPRPYDPEELAKISAPVVALWSRETTKGTWVSKSAQYLAQHVADGHVRELAGIGHFAPLLAPESIAEELISFFGSVG